MAAYDPKRPRPAQLAEDAAPVDALLEPTAPPAVRSDPPPSPGTRAEPTVVTEPEPVVVPVAPAPEVGTTNRAVLYASLGVGALLVALLVVLRVRARRAAGGSAGGSADS